MKQLLASLALAIALVGPAFAQVPAAVPPADATKTAAPAKAAKADVAGKTKAAGAAAQNVVDINTASEAELAALPGVGADIAKKIIAARPFSRKDQLVFKKLLAKPDYAKIKDQIIARQPKK